MNKTPEQYQALLSTIHDEALAALADDRDQSLRKALENIGAMARYGAAVDAPSDRVRKQEDRP
jgi:hypothetical protein